MFNPWFALSLKTVQMGMEAQSVIALRMLRMAAGGARAEAEVGRMVSEKVVAAACDLTRPASFKACLPLSRTLRHGSPTEICGCEFPRLSSRS
jgi:hypothetical protein